VVSAYHDAHHRHIRCLLTLVHHITMPLFFFSETLLCASLSVLCYTRPRTEPPPYLSCPCPPTLTFQRPIPRSPRPLRPFPPLPPYSPPNPQRPGSRWLGCISGRGSASGHRQGPCPTNRLPFPDRLVPLLCLPLPNCQNKSQGWCCCAANQTRYHSRFETPFSPLFTQFLEEVTTAQGGLLCQLSPV
jgi:hypothetical protein